MLQASWPTGALSMCRRRRRHIRNCEARATDATGCAAAEIETSKNEEGVGRDYVGAVETSLVLRVILPDPGRHPLRSLEHGRRAIRLPFSLYHVLGPKRDLTALPAVPTSLPKITMWTARVPRRSSLISIFFSFHVHGPSLFPLRPQVERKWCAAGNHQTPSTAHIDDGARLSSLYMHTAEQSKTMVETRSIEAGPFVRVGSPKMVTDIRRA
ncbi:hypothetical protein PsYK624_089060 [Phanerochaete sordida]|uniref:Uncharacterized protein n=1 Tax=Phanerochaete sordida TaxID=48140 RepID=A0A9P3GDH8_9APHY|nr:hypothetical protein PsYK624_089060 [Phanerochaete sordida]